MEQNLLRKTTKGAEFLSSYYEKKIPSGVRARPIANVLQIPLCNIHNVRLGEEKKMELMISTGIVERETCDRGRMNEGAESGTKRKGRVSAK